jgi:alkylation response protein AidB-like acyl-CoA dehydrogenase
VREFIDEQMALGGFEPHCDSWMTAFSPEFSRALGARGWIGMTFPRSLGGADAASEDRYVVIEELLAAGAPVAAHWFADRQVGPALLRHGTLAQRREHLPAIARGERYFAIGMSEPDSGSDLASVRTRAEFADGRWHLSGSKVWTSHAHLAQYALVLARTDPSDGGDRRQGLSQFLVDLRAAGVEVRPIVTLDGGQHFNEVIFDGVALDEDEALLGGRGNGWAQVMAELALERSGPERFLSTMPLLRCAVARLRNDVDAAGLGLLLAELRSIRAMSTAVAEALGRGETPSVQAAIVKDQGTRFEGKVVAFVRAAATVVPELDTTDDLARLLAEAVLHGPDRTLRGGTNEILRGIIARELIPS